MTTLTTELKEISNPSAVAWEWSDTYQASSTTVSKAPTSTRSFGSSDSGVECVVTLTDPYGNHATFSPGPADSTGSCSAYLTGWPAGDTVSVSAQPVSVTSGN